MGNPLKQNKISIKIEEISHWRMRYVIALVQLYTEFFPHKQHLTEHIQRWSCKFEPKNVKVWRMCFKVVET